jgi:nicotinate phosphoribosyltransferase
MARPDGSAGSGAPTSPPAPTAYFNRTKAIVAVRRQARHLRVFLRRPVISAPRLMLDWLKEVAPTAAHGSRSI